MKITKGDKTINISGFALFVGAVILDNIVANVCKTVSYKNFAENVAKVTKDEGEA